MTMRFNSRDDRGVAMLTVVMVLAVVAALGMAAVTVSATNLRNAGRDRFATTAQGAAEAAVAAAESYLQTVPAQALSCSTATTQCSSNPWGNQNSPQTLSFPGGRTATAWIQTVQAYNPPTYKSSVYVIHVVGKSSTVIGVRTIDEEVSVSPLDFPFGIYVDTKINDTGNPTVTNESVFSRSCIDSRSKLRLTGIDPYYNIPAAAHSGQYITDSNINNCLDPTNAQMHDANAEHYDVTGGANKHFCQPTLGQGSNVVDTRYDQDSIGGPFSADVTPVSGGTTEGAICTNAPNQYTDNSHFDPNALNSQYAWTQGGLTADQYSMLKTVAQSQNNYYTHSNFNTINWTNLQSYSNAVLYLELQSGDNVNIGSGNVSSFQWVDEPNGACTQQHPSVIIIVRNGDLTFGSGVSFTGATFVPEGTLSVSGGLTLVGTIFANAMKISGSPTIQLNSCYIKNIPGPILNVTPVRFHEKDS